MNYLYLFLSITILFTSCKKNDDFVYTDAKILPLYGQLDNADGFKRLPEDIKISGKIKALGTHSAGLNVRFRSNSPSIKIKWSIKYEENSPHMTSLVTSGLDLYCLKDSTYQFVGIFRPTSKENIDSIIGIDSTNHEYLLNLPLYNEITNLEIGVPKGYYLKPSTLRPKGTPIVFYGTSITQGAAASRPGTCYTSIVSRTLNKEVINLGFSGNGFFQKNIAIEFMKENPSLIFLDCTPNSHPDTINKNLPEIITYIRSKNKSVPIVLIESIIREDSYFKKNKLKSIKEQNEALRKVYLTHKDSSMYLIGSENIIGGDHEATVDGTHFTDLGFKRFSDTIIQFTKNITSP